MYGDRRRCPVYLAIVLRLLLFASGLGKCLGSIAQVDTTAGDSAWLPHSWAQRHDEITLLAGYHQGLHGFAELGVGRNIYGVVHHPYDLGYYLGAELRVDRPELVGLKVGAYVDGGVAMGVQVIRYMEAGEGCTVLRPEIGIGVLKAKVTYAYNLRLTSPKLPGINAHILSLTYAVRLKLLRGDDKAHAR